MGDAASIEAAKLRHAKKARHACTFIVLSLIVLSSLVLSHMPPPPRSAFPSSWQPSPSSSATPSWPTSSCTTRWRRWGWTRPRCSMPRPSSRETRAYRRIAARRNSMVSASYDAMVAIVEPFLQVFGSIRRLQQLQLCVKRRDDRRVRRAEPRHKLQSVHAVAVPLAERVQRCHAHGRAARVPSSRSHLSWRSIVYLTYSAIRRHPLLRRSESHRCRSPERRPRLRGRPSRRTGCRGTPATRAPSHAQPA